MDGFCQDSPGISFFPFFFFSTRDRTHSFALAKWALMPLAKSPAHLKFLLGHKVLHAPDDLDGGPVVLSQPVEKERRA